MLTLTCLIVGEGSVFAVKIDDKELVSILKKVIWEEIKKLTDCDARELTLYMAKKNGDKNGKWMNDDDEDPEVRKLSKADALEDVKDVYLKKEMLMSRSLGLDDYFKGDIPKKGKIHVLVKLPTPPVINVPSPEEEKDALRVVQQEKRRREEELQEEKRKKLKTKLASSDPFQTLKKLISVSSFKEIRENGYCYVDKSKILIDLQKTYKHVFLSRPRRFGKSLAVSVLEHLFRGEKYLFEGLYAYDNWDWKVKFPVLRFDFSIMDATKFEHDLISQMTKRAAAWQIELSYSSVDSVGDVLESLVEKLHNLYGHCVILIDEYDKPVISCFNLPMEKMETLAKNNMNVMTNFFQAIKAVSNRIRFSFVTGSSRLAMSTIFSGDNAREDISYIGDFDTICGFTETDLQPFLNHTGDSLHLDTIKKWYNGYQFGGDEYVYNPFGVVNYFAKGKADMYWVNSGLTSSITKFSQLSDISNFVLQLADEEEEITIGLTNLTLTVTVEMLLEKQVPIEYLMLQAGYLSFSRIDNENCLVKVPNQEVKEGVLPRLAWICIKGVNPNRTLENVCRAIKQANMQALYEYAYSLLSQVGYPNAKISNSEDYYKALLFIAFKLMPGIQCQTETRISSGRVDLHLTLGSKNLYLASGSSSIIIELKVLHNCPEKPNAEAKERVVKEAKKALEQARGYVAGVNANIIAGWVINTSKRTLIDVETYGGECHQYVDLRAKANDDDDCVGNGEMVTTL